MKLKTILRGVTAVLAGCFAAQALATPIFVAESGDTYTSAYVVSSFGLGFDANIGNSTTIPNATVTGTNEHATDVDWFSFYVNAGSTVVLDVDTDAYGGLFDTTLAFWDVSGNLLAQSDDNAYDPGSTTAGYYYYNSLISTTVASAGLYYASVSNYSNFGTTPFNYTGTGYYDTDGLFDLHISLSDPASVPEPGSLGLLGLAFMFLARKRRRIIA